MSGAETAATITNAHFQPMVSPMSGTELPATSVAMGPLDCLRPKAMPWWWSGTSLASTRLVAGSANPLATPASDMKASSDGHERPSTAMPSTAAVVMAAPTAMPRRPPSRSTALPPGAEDSADTR